MEQGEYVPNDGTLGSQIMAVFPEREMDISHYHEHGISNPLKINCLNLMDNMTVSGADISFRQRPISPLKLVL